MGGAQPLAVTMNDGVCLCVDVDPSRLQRRVDQRYLDEWTSDLDDGVARVARREARSRRAQCGTASATRRPSSPELLRRGVEVDIVTDQTSAHDPLSYLPEGIDLDDWHDYAEKKPEEFTDRARAVDGRATSRRWSASWTRGAEVFDYGNSLRGEAQLGGYPRAFAYPGFVPGVHSPALLRGQGPLPLGRALGRPERHRARPTRRCSSSSPRTSRCAAGSRRPQERVAFQGLPARICWLGYGERDKRGRSRSTSSSRTVR